MGLLINKHSDRVMETLDCIDIPALMLNADGKILSVNSAAENTFQYAHADIAGRDVSILLSRSRDLLEKNIEDSSVPVEENSRSFCGSCEAVCRKKNGDSFSAQISFIRQETGDRTLAVVQDVSERKRLVRRASQRTKELAVFNTFAKILSSHMDTGSIIQETIEMLYSTMDADAAWLYLADDKTGEIFLKAQKGLDGGRETLRRLKPGESFNGKVFASGRPLVVKNASLDPRVRERETKRESMAGVPVLSRGNVLGVLGVASRKFDYFSAMDIQLLSNIGGQLAVAIENAKLIGQLQEKMSQIELTSELGGLINSSLSIGTIFRIMASEIKKLIGYDRASLLLYNEKEDSLLIFALDTNMKTVLKKGVKAPIEGTSAGWVVRNNRPWINYDLNSIKFTLDKRLFNEGIRSTISIPLYHDRILGVFNLDSTELSKYSEQDLQILLPAAKHISIALENALLFKEISREKKEWEKTFDAITDMVWIEDGQQRVIRANETLLSKTGFPAADMAGRRCDEILEVLDIRAACCLCEDTMTNKRPSFRELRGGGGNIYHFWAYPLIDDDGRLYAIVHYLKDVTSQKRLEQQLIRSERLASLGTLVAGIAHEINNPLGIIAGYSEALIDRAKDRSLMDLKEFEDFPEYLDTIHNEIFRCKGILKSLLDFARPSGGTFREIDINELIKEVILLVNHRAKRLSHNIEFRLNRDLPKICADPGSLRQLFMNIIINSLYFTPEGGNIVIVTDTDFDAAGKEVGTERIKVIIRDSGTGIPGDIIDKVFNPFFTTKPVGDGTGLGLAICHRIVEEHGGSIDVESEENNGTTFIIRLPANARDKNPCS
jgi:two-component system NtrC family sensor kinase